MKPVLEWVRKSAFVYTAWCGERLMRVCQDGDPASSTFGMWSWKPNCHHYSEAAAQLEAERETRKQARATLSALTRRRK